MSEMVKLGVVLTAKQVEQLDARAEREGRSRSSMIRKAIDLGFSMLKAQDALLGAGNYLHLNGADGSPPSAVSFPGMGITGSRTDGGEQ